MIATNLSGKLVRRFILQRDKDVSGVSGTGIVAQGCQFSNGWCALHWLSDLTSVALYESIEKLEQVHGHEGSTKVVLVD